ncbi:MAG: class I SAM-dependent methyltransferase [Dehalococcoidales bacterium]
MDAGCGDGYFSLTASVIVGSDGKVYAIDIYETSIDTLRKVISDRSISNLEAITADITGKTPLASESIDICLLANVLHGFVENREVEGVLKEITRVLKAGATLAVVDFKKISNTPGPPLSIRLNPDQVSAIITPYHHRKKKVIEVGPYHYVAVFNKE